MAHADANHFFALAFQWITTVMGVPAVWSGRLTSRKRRASALISKKRLSGDQKGFSAFSLSGRGRAASESRSRTRAESGPRRGR